MKLDEAQLQRAARLADTAELTFWTEKASASEHIFSESFEADWRQLCARVADHQIPPYRVSLGWPYYVRRSIAVVLLCGLLACLTMPEVVQAGCEKLVEAVKHMVTEYTEYRYHSTVSDDTEMVPLHISYLPEGMQQTEYHADEYELRVLYQKGQQYFTLDQRLVTENDQLVYLFDTEDARIENTTLHSAKLELIYKEDRITYIWLYGAYHISGTSNLGIEELQKILNGLSL